METIKDGARLLQQLAIVSQRCAQSVHDRVKARSFESVAQVYGAGAIGVVLTGMGDDGTRGLRALWAAGGQTLAQDAASCVVYGMPRVAWEAGACKEQLSLDLIGARMLALLTGQGTLGLAWRLRDHRSLPQLSAGMLRSHCSGLQLRRRISCPRDVHDG